MQNKEVKVVMAHTTELKPDSKYLIVLDDATINIETADKLLKALREMGIPNTVAITVHGDATKSVQVIEQ